MTQRKYNLTMAVVMGKDMDSVICDTEATAKECIHWLRQNQVAPMTFFPLDTVRAKVCLSGSWPCDTAQMFCSVMSALASV